MKNIPRFSLSSAVRIARANADIVAVVTVAVLVRIWAFGDIPPGLNQDEAATAYDAWSVLNYGVDRNGFPFPMMFVSWGSGMYALNGYLAWPFLLVLGLTETAARLPHLTIGIASLFLFYGLARRVSDRTTAVTALFLLAINPWHIMISRWSLDSNVFPAFFLAAVFLLVSGLKKPLSLLWSAFFLGLCFYLYGTAYVIVPIFALISVALLHVFWRFRIKTILTPALITLSMSTPVVLYVLVNRFHWNSIVLPFFSIPRLTGEPRFQTATTVFGGGLSDVLHNLRTFFELLITQNDSLIWNVLPGYGFLYIIGLPFVIIGLLAGIRSILIHHGKDPLVFLYAWLFSVLVLASFQSANINRVNIVFLPLIFFCALGVETAARGSAFIRSGIISIFFISFTLFTHTYFTSYRDLAAPDFFAGLVPAISRAVVQTDEPICVTGAANMPYIFALFAEKTDPRLFTETVNYDNPGAEFQWVNSFGRFTFGLDRCRERSYGAYVLHSNEVWRFNRDLYDIELFDYYAVAVPRPS